MGEQKHLWEYEHEYYSNDGNYFSNDCFTEFESFQDFLDEWDDADIDMNLIFRWDWKKDETGDYLHIYRIGQRKGIYSGQIIKVTDSDEAVVKQYLGKYKPTIISFWEGI